MSDFLSSIFGGSTSTWKSFLFGGETQGIVGCGGAEEGSVSTSADASGSDAKDGFFLFFDTPKPEIAEVDITYVDIPTETMEESSAPILDKDNDGFIDIEYEKDGLCFNYEKHGEEGLNPNKYCDCNDEDENIFPGAKEKLADQVDQNCNGHNDEDWDSDKYTVDGIINEGKLYKDCNDKDPMINPGAKEKFCDGKDQDCDGKDFTDGDGDGEDGCLWSYPYDCNDKDSNVNLNAKEIPCNDVDENCDNKFGGGTDKDGDGVYVDGGFCGPIDCDDNAPQVYPGAQEKCNAIDDNCDGLTDEGLIEFSYSGPAGTEGIGICHAKTKQCVEGQWKQTFDEVLPASVETCNQIDDTCNGKTNEDLSPILSYSGDPKTRNIGICSEEVKVCENGIYVVKKTEILPQVESCNNLDDNCDGKIDDGLINTAYSGPAGTEGKGICQAEVEQCVAGNWKVIQSQKTPQLEVCDGIDNDCNGKTDDDLLKVTYSSDPKTLGVGVCQPKKEDCINGQYVTLQNEVTPSAEVCDNQDNNCDGNTDELLFQSYYTGPDGTLNKGECKAGSKQCENGQWNAVALPVTPTSETCDNKDNDCNGQTDENLVLTSYSADPKTKDVGICKPEIKVCQNGLFVIQQAQILPQTDIACNLIDEDCDGIVFQGTDKDGDGIKLESALCGPVDCDDNDKTVFPGSPELYDCKDNNCDGKVDNEISLTKADAIFIGENKGMTAGKAISSGDINGDGYSDIFILEAPSFVYAPSKQKNYLIYGGKSLYGTYLLNTKSDAIFTTDNAADSLTQIDPSGNINGDGFHDILAVSYNYGSPNKIFLIWGSNNKFVGTYDQTTSANVTWTSNVMIANTSGIIAGGDINNDGFGDIVITRSLGWPYSAESLVLLGNPNFKGEYNLDAAANYIYKAQSPVYATSFGDINNDGFSDLVLGGIINTSGIIWGSPNLPITMYSNDMPFIGNITTNTASGDINGDGHDDLVLGNNGWSKAGNNLTGVIYVKYGKKNLAGSLDLNMADATIFSGDEFSIPRSLVTGDLNGDKLKDIAFTYHFEKVFVIYGSNTLYGKHALEYVSNLSFIGNWDELNGGNLVIKDINNDGNGDILISTPQSNKGAKFGGAAYLFYGKKCEAPKKDDFDGDGIPGTPSGPDCNDDNPSISPGASEIACDNIDQDCDGKDFAGTDKDGDGYKTEGGFCGLADCDDTNPLIFPTPCNTDPAKNCGVNVGTDIDKDGFKKEGGLCGPIDCDDNNPAVNPGKEESECDGVDNNCNKLEFQGIKGTEKRVTNDVHASIYPSLVWNGNGYGLSWADDRDGSWQIYFSRLDVNGNKIGGDLKVTNGPEDCAWNSSLVWNGAGYGLGWVEKKDSTNWLYFAKLNPTGNILDKKSLMMGG